MKLTLTFCLVFVSIFVFGQKKSKVISPPRILNMESPDFINACELPNHKKELVYTRFIYSGIDEYWGLKPEKKCSEINAYLEIPEHIEVRSDDLKKLRLVHDNYWKMYLIIDVVGTFEDPNPSGFGHLGSNNSRFTVKYFVDMYVADKKTSNK